MNKLFYCCFGAGFVLKKRVFTHQGHVSKLFIRTSPGFYGISSHISVKLCVGPVVGAGFLSGGVRHAVEAHASAGVFLSHVGAMLSDS